MTQSSEAARGRLIAAVPLNHETNLLRFRMDERLRTFAPGQYIEMLDIDTMEYYRDRYHRTK